jgi:membrane protein DedA with SNARE-associated domain
MHFFLHFIVQFKYAAIFCLLMLGIFGLPVPDETLLAFCGFLVLNGKLEFTATLAAAFLGSCMGISLSYILGRKLGPKAVRQFGKFVHIDEETLDRVHRWFAHYGRWSLTGGYFFPGFRHLTAIIAGASGLEFKVFAPFAFGGALLWSAAFVTLGYTVGARWESMSDSMHRLLLVILAVFVSLALIAAGVRRIIRKKSAGRRK